MMIRNVESRNILQGLFNKWQGKDKEVINEAKVEDVQTTIMVEPPKLYTLTFRKGYKDTNGNIRWRAFFGEIYLCPCYDYEKEMVEYDFNHLKRNGLSIVKIQDWLKDKYHLDYDMRDYSNNKGCLSKKEYSFRKTNNPKRVELWYRFEKVLELVCQCYIKEEQQVLKECRKLVSQNKSKEDIRKLLKQKYRISRWDDTPYADKIVPLANYSWNDRGFLLKNGENTKIVPADFNDIESVLINNGSTRSVVSLLPNCDYEALMDLSKYCKTDEYAALRRAGIEIMNSK